MPRKKDLCVVSHRTDLVQNADSHGTDYVLNHFYIEVILYRMLIHMELIMY